MALLAAALAVALGAPNGWLLLRCFRFLRIAGVVFHLLEHAALEDVFGLDAEKVGLAQAVFALGDDTAGMTEPGPLEGVTNTAGIRETGLAHAAFEIITEGAARFLGERVLLLGEHELADLHELVEAVVGEVDVMGDA